MNKQHGLSLIELMISITLGLILMTGVVQMFLSSKATFSTQQGMSRIQETGRLAMEFIGRDLRMASFFGCTNTLDFSSGALVDPLNPTLFIHNRRISDPVTGTAGFNATDGLHRDFTTGLRGYNTSPSTVNDTLPNSVETDLGLGFVVTPNSDVLVIRGTNERGLLVSPGFENNDTDVFGFTTATLTNGCIDGFCLNGVAVISDCEHGRVFQISAVPAVAGNNVTLSHADNWTVLTSDKNLYTSGEVLPVHTFVYFVAISDIPVGNTVPSLWQKIDNQAPLELLQGVENMAIKYGVKGTNYQKAANVTNWDAINSIRIEFLVQGLDTNAVDTPQPYTFDEVLTTPTDRRIRQVFTSTFGIRTRINEFME